ncbi:lysozyme [Paenibacillus sp. FSL R5-808]|jgi:GH24 family phage-related lysozyme (muramidase)|uniref:lysozyme n=1 Tax=unclassified Paenibacillus TaxID=185978 RepID=UPI0003E288EA|nr:lysozyme [Paenibacillus sp. FSL R5-808]ETT32118.1 putative lysozyme [Paenibacillus sp. FSL R5-808]
MKRKISQAGIKLIKNFEGCRLTAYKPVPTEVYWTIGWGHHGPDVKQGMTITQVQADAMLVKDLAKYEAYVNDREYVPITDKLNQNQFDALVSFCYNCGPGNLKKLCSGRSIEQIANSITAYNKAGGKVLNGLVRRREAELTLFNKKEEKTVAQERDINIVSTWAASAWEAATKLGYFDGTRPGAPITREEMAIVIMRMENKK